MENANSKEYLEKILGQVLENMKRTAHAPSVQMTDVPRESLGMNDDEEAALDDLDEDENPDKRITQRKADKYVEKDGELSESEDEEINEANGIRRQSSRRRRININYRSIMDVSGDSGVETGSALGTPQQGSSVPDDGDVMNVDVAVPEEQTPSPTQGLNGSTAVSGAVSSQQSPAPAALATDDDVTMGDAEPDVPDESTVTVAQERTPPDSPPPEHDTVVAAPAPGPERQAEEAGIKEETATEEDAAVTGTQDEGRMEHDTENAKGEASAAGAAKAEL